METLKYQKHSFCWFMKTIMGNFINNNAITIKILFTINRLFGYCMGNFSTYDWMLASKHRIKVLKTDLI